MNPRPSNPASEDLEKRKDPAATPPAGPHAEPALQDDLKTPGAGSLPDPGGAATPEADVGPD